MSIVLFAVERAREPLTFALCSPGGRITVPAGCESARIVVLGCFQTQPIAAVHLNRVRRARTTREAEEILGLVEPLEREPVTKPIALAS